jgi:type I restriction enzyme S subunit
MSAVAEEKNEFPEKWERVFLGDISSDISYGYTASSTDQPVGPRMLRITDIQNNAVNWCAVPYCEIDKDQVDKYLLAPNDIVFARTGATVGKSFLIPSTVSNSIYASYLIRVRLAEGIDPKYISYFFHSGDYWLQIRENQAGIGQPNVNGSKLKKLEIPLAPPEQQKRIVAKVEELFSHIDAGIDALKKAKQLLKQYRQSVLKAAVTGELTKEWREVNKAKLEPASQLLERILKERRQKWEEQQLEQFKAKGKMPKDDKWKEKYIEPEVHDGRPPFELPIEWTWAYMEQLGKVMGGLTKNKKREQFELQLPYLRVANVYANDLRLDDVTTIGVQENELERVLLEKGDLLIVEGNGSSEQIGRLAIWDGSIDPCVHQNHLIKVRLQEKGSGNYLMYWLSSMGGRDAILQVASSTSGLYTLSISKVSGLLIPLPPIEEQIVIDNLVLSKLSSIDHLDNEIDFQLRKAGKNKQSILASAFSGMLTGCIHSDKLLIN